LRLFSFGGYGLALAALALVVFGAIECPPKISRISPLKFRNMIKYIFVLPFETFFRNNSNNDMGQNRVLKLISQFILNKG